MSPTDYERRSPAYAQYYYKQAAEDNQRAYDQQQRAELAKWAKTSGYLGNEGQLGLPSANPELQSQPGTGVYAEGFDPQRKEMMLRNQQRIMSGNKAMQEQGMSMEESMQDSRNTGINQVDLSKWKKENVPIKAATSLEQLANYKRKLEVKGEDTTMVDARMRKLVNPTKGTQLISDGQGGFSYTQGDVSGNANPLNLGTTANNTIDKSIIDSVKQAGNLFSIGSSYADEYLGMFADAKGVLGYMGDRVGMKGGMVEFNANRTAFANKVEQQFNAYKNAITGSASSAEESDQIRKSIMNMDQGPEGFKAAFKVFVEGQLRELETLARIKGIPSSQVYELFGFDVAESGGKLYVNKTGGNQKGDWEEVAR